MRIFQAHAYVMASTEVSGNVKTLGATSEWMVANTGHSRSHVLETSVKNLVSSLCDLLSYYDTHLEQSPSTEVLLEVQELCISIAPHSEILPLTEALLHHCHKHRWEFPLSTEHCSFPVAPVAPLSLQFLETITKLSRSGLQTLSYESLVILWTKYPPALHQELMDLARTFTSLSSEEALSNCFDSHALLAACADSSGLFESSKTFLKQLAEREPDKSLLLHLFTQAVTRKSHSKNIKKNPIK